MKRNRNNPIPYIIIFLFAFLLYGNTLKFDYTLDDLMVIKENAFTVKGLSGIGDIFSYDSFTGFFGKEKKLVVGGRYRPFSIATFAVEYALVGKFSPFLSHLINILLYAFTGMFIFMILKRLLKQSSGNPWFISMPFIAAMIFLAHPVHTEVIANIKGRDEILALLFPLMSLYLILLYLDNKMLALPAMASLIFFLGMLSKENAIVFVLLIPVSLYFFTNAPLKQTLSIGIALLFMAILFVFLRFIVLGYISGGKLPDELLNNPFLDANFSQKYGTIFYTLGLYLKLLVFPLTLTHDYYPYHIPLISFTDYRSLLPFIFYTGLVGYTLISFRRKGWLAFSALLYLLPLAIVSNLLFPVGTFMNERFIYVSSLGFVVALAWFVDKKLPGLIDNKFRLHRYTSIVILTVLLLFSVRTVSRNNVWKNNYTLFTSDVVVSVNSVKCNIAAGGELMKKAENEPDSIQKEKMYQSSMKFLEKAIQLYPRATNGYILYGNALATYQKKPKIAIEQYLKVLEYNPFEINAFNNTLRVLASVENATDVDYKLNIYTRLLKIDPESSEVNYYLGKLNGQFVGNFDTATYFLEKSIRLSPDNIAAYRDLGIVYSMKGKFQEALIVFSKAQKLAPEDQTIMKNILTTQQIMQKQ